jgi:thiol-disulfide isomerase/thioredoxin
MSSLRFETVMSALLLLAILGLVSSCGGGTTTTAEGSSETPAVEAAAREDGVIMAPDFVLKDVNGNTVRLSDYDGNVRLVDFWTTWCAPCKEEIPMFKELQETYGPDGFTILAISMDDDGLEVVKPFVEKYRIDYVNLIGNEEVALKFGGIVGYPTAYLVDREGGISAPFVGPKPKRVLEKKIRALLGKDAKAGI